MSPERTPPSFHDLPFRRNVPFLRDYPDLFLDKESLQLLEEIWARTLTCVGREAAGESSLFHYWMDTDETGQLLLRETWTGNEYPAIAFFRQALDRVPEKSPAHEKYTAEIDGFNRLQKLLNRAPEGSTYVWMSPRDPEVSGYGTMSKLWFGVIDTYEHRPAIRVLDVPNAMTNDDRHQFLTLLGKDTLIPFIQTPNDYLRTPIVFRADTEPRSVEELLDHYTATASLGIEDRLMALQRLFGQHIMATDEAHVFARRLMHKLSTIPRDADKNAAIQEVIAAFVRKTYEQTKTIRRDSFFSSPDWRAYYYHGRPIKMDLGCIAMKTGNPLQTPIERLLQTMRDWLGSSEEGMTCPTEECYKKGWANIKKGECCPGCGTKRVC